MGNEQMSRTELYGRRSRNYFKLVPHALVYPARGEGKLTLLLLAGLLWFGFTLASILPGLLALLGLLLYFFLQGYLAAYLIKVVGTSAQGREELPDLPEVADIVMDVFYPLFLLLGAVLLCQFPALILYLGRGYGEWRISEDWVQVASWVGVLYMPMSVVTVSLFESVSAMHPLLVLRWIARVPLQYAFACLVVFGVLIVTEYVAIDLGGTAPILGSFLFSTVNLYGLLVSMRILGLLYYANEGKLAWK